MNDEIKAGDNNLASLEDKHKKAEASYHYIALMNYLERNERQAQRNQHNIVIDDYNRKLQESSTRKIHLLQEELEHEEDEWRTKYQHQKQYFITRVEELEEESKRLQDEISQQSEMIRERDGLINCQNQFVNEKIDEGFRMNAKCKDLEEQLKVKCKEVNKMDEMIKMHIPLINEYNEYRRNKYGDAEDQDDSDEEW